MRIHESTHAPVQRIWVARSNEAAGYWMHWGRTLPGLLQELTRAHAARGLCAGIAAPVAYALRDWLHLEWPHAWGGVSWLVCKRGPGGWRFGWERTAHVPTLPLLLEHNPTAALQMCQAWSEASLALHWSGRWIDLSREVPGADS